MQKKKPPKINKTLQKIAEDTSKANIQTSSSIKSTSNQVIKETGEPVCLICHDLGYYRVEVPVGHPDFGKLHLCECRLGQVNLQARQRLYALSHLDDLSHLSFDNFKPRGMVGLSPKQADSLELAYNHAQRFAADLKGWLLFQGGYGCGKTHLAAAIANFTVNLGVPTLFITVPDLLDSLRFAFNSSETTFEERFDEIRSAHLLILDDFGTQNATEWAQEKLFQIINFRYINHLPTVITTNLSDRDIEERINSRLSDPELVTRVKILASDYRDPTGDLGHHELSSLGDLHKLTFANFDLRKNEDLDKEDLQSLEKAFNACREFAKNPRGWLLILGTYGCGKTHLAAAIANYRSDNSSPPLFVGVTELMDHLRATFSPNSTVSLDRRFEEIRNAPLLILDDLGSQVTSPWAKEKLHQLFNQRYNAELPTVITSAVKLEDMDPRLRSRVIDKRLCTIYAITVPAYASRDLRTGPSKTRRKRIA